MTSQFMSNSLVTDLINFRQNTYCSAQRGELARSEARRREEYLWSGRLSVGSFKSWDCCPKKIVHETLKTKCWPASLLFKFSLGHSIHEVYQKGAMNTPGLKMIKPYHMPDVSIKRRGEDGEEYYQTLRERLEESWPETPVCYRDPGTGQVLVMGYADEVEVYYGKPVVLDIKSINDDPLEFKLRFDEIIKDKVEAHLIQTQFYAIMMNLDEYYLPLKIEKTKILYVSTKLLGTPEGERELVFPLKDEQYTKFGLLMVESSRQLFGHDKDRDISCNYRYCSDHM